MSLTLITARRVIAEVLRDRRTVALVLLVPSFMLWLMYLIYDGNRRLFDSIAVLMLGVFPMLMMFIIASVSMQRERSNGTLERLWTTRLSRIQFLAAYGISFSFFALLQSTLLVGVAHWLLDVTTAAPLGWVFLATIRHCRRIVGTYDQHLCQQRIPSRAIHARCDRAAIPAQRCARPQRHHAEGTGNSFQCPAAVLRYRRPP